MKPAMSILAAYSSGSVVISGCALHPLATPFRPTLVANRGAPSSRRPGGTGGVPGLTPGSSQEHSAKLPQRDGTFHSLSRPCPAFRSKEGGEADSTPCIERSRFRAIGRWSE